MKVKQSVWRRSAKLFKVLNIWGIGGIDKRTGGETLFKWVSVVLKTLSAIISFDYCKSGVLIDFLVWIQDPSPVDQNYSESPRVTCLVYKDQVPAPDPFLRCVGKCLSDSTSTREESWTGRSPKLRLDICLARHKFIWAGSESANAADCKSVPYRVVGSTPTPPTRVSNGTGNRCLERGYASSLA